MLYCAGNNLRKTACSDQAEAGHELRNPDFLPFDKD